jgi:low affinity Fe/Cu permease
VVRPERHPAASDEEREKRNAAMLKAWLAALVIAACYAVLGGFAAVSAAHRELLGLAGAYAAGPLFAASAVWQLTRKNRRLVDEFRQTVSDAQAKSGSSLDLATS